MTRTLAIRPLGLGVAIVSAMLLAFLAPAGGAGTARAADPMAGPAAASVDAAAGVAGEPGPGVVPVMAPAPAPEPGPGLQLVWHGPRAKRVVALTFDDGWSAATLRRIYRILVREHVPATFFVTGIYVQRAPALWRRIAAAGFPLAGHSYRHRDTRLLTPHEAARDFALTRAAIEDATGRPMLPLFRPPYGARNAVTDRMAVAAGFPVVVMWDATGGDTSRGANVASVVRDASRGARGSIVLLHAGPRVTPRALPRIIARYRARGFGFVTVPDLLGLPPDQRVVRVPAPAAPQGRVPDRAMDRAGDATAAAPPAGAPVTALAPAPAPVTGGPPDAPAAPSAPSAEARPARDAAWARSGGTPTALAEGTAAALAVLFVLAAIRGRRRRPAEEPFAVTAEPVATDAEPAA